MCSSTQQSVTFAPADVVSAFFTGSSVKTAVHKLYWYEVKYSSAVRTAVALESQQKKHITPHTCYEDWNIGRGPWMWTTAVNISNVGGGLLFQYQCSSTAVQQSMGLPC